MTMRRAILAAAAAAIVMPLLGCGKSTTVTGNVTYEGTPVAKGSITFAPADGKGPSAGGPIEQGKYTVNAITPGKKLVQIIAVKQIQFPKSSAEMAKAAEEAAKKGTTMQVERADEIPANAQGNNVEVEVKSGENKLDFHLKKPAAP